MKAKNKKANGTVLKKEQGCHENGLGRDEGAVNVFA